MEKLLFVSACKKLLWFGFSLVFGFLLFFLFPLGHLSVCATKLSHQEKKKSFSVDGYL